MPDQPDWEVWTRVATAKAAEPPITAGPNLHLFSCHFRVNMPDIGADKCSHGDVVQSPQPPVELGVPRVEQLQSVDHAPPDDTVGATTTTLAV